MSSAHGSRKVLPNVGLCACQDSLSSLADWALHTRIGPPAGPESADTRLAAGLAGLRTFPRSASGEFSVPACLKMNMTTKIIFS